MSVGTALRKPPKTAVLPVLLGLTLTMMGSAAMAQNQTGQVRDTMSDTWVATDALARTLPDIEQCGPIREDKIVGIFYFVWLGAHSKHVYDITKILAQNPEEAPWGPPGAFHHWGEPHFGYYQSNDEFVIRKHAQMLCDAGVDVLFSDVTNAVTYDENYLTICRVFEQLRKAGRKTPQLAFLTNSQSGKVVQRLYDNFYSKNLYPGLWFMWDGKPLILAKREEMSPQCREFFTVRQSWAWTDPNGWFGDGKDKWPWLDHHPQNPGWHDSPDAPEQLPVCVAQHPVSNIGRSFHDGKQPPADQLATDSGPCFDEQFERALQVDPRVVFITGWNEWVAQRFIKPEKGGPGIIAGKPLKPGDSYFVDQYDREFSRDIEPMRGEHQDNYYYQMVSWIRRFKGVRQRPKASDPRTISINADFSQWDAVGPEFLDDLMDTTHRNHSAWEPLPDYVNTSGRNDFEAAKVARDDSNLHFYIRTREPITAPEGDRWMLLLINADGNPSTGWEGFDILVNRLRGEPGTCSVERSRGGWSWEPAGEAQIAFAGRELHLAVSRQTLGLSPDAGKLSIDLKWADNTPREADITDFIDIGDVAPNGRFCYRYEE